MSILRDPRPSSDSGLPLCICGEEVAVPHTECLAMAGAERKDKDDA